MTSGQPGSRRDQACCLLYHSSNASCPQKRRENRPLRRLAFATTFVDLHPKADFAPLSVYARKPSEKIKNTDKARNLANLRLSCRHRIHCQRAGHSAFTQILDDLNDKPHAPSVRGSSTGCIASSIGLTILHSEDTVRGMRTSLAPPCPRTWFFPLRSEIPAYFESIRRSGMRDRCRSYCLCGC